VRFLALDLLASAGVSSLRLRAVHEAEAKREAQPADSASEILKATASEQRSGSTGAEK